MDLLAIDLFATMVQQYEAFITLDATKIIAEKFKSPSADEVLLALNVSVCLFIYLLSHSHNKRNNRISVNCESTKLV